MKFDEFFEIVDIKWEDIQFNIYNKDRTTAEVLTKEKLSAKYPLWDYEEFDVESVKMYNAIDIKNNQIIKITPILQVFLYPNEW